MNEALAQFASPAKRHKKFDPDSGIVTPRATRSGLMSSTPGPATPGTHGGCTHRTGAGAAAPCQSSGRLDGQLALLREFLSATYASMSLLRTRGQATTYANLQKPVEHLCDKSFKVYHLRQIKALYPEAFTWQHVRGTGTDSKDQLLLSLRGAASGAASPSAGRLSSAEQSREFEKRVKGFMEQHKGEDTSTIELPLADMPPPCPTRASPASGASSQTVHQPRSATPSKVTGAGGALPGTPQTGAAGKLLFASPAAATPDASARRPTACATPAGLFSPVSRPPRSTHTAGPVARRTGNLFGTPNAAAAARPAPATGGNPSKMRRLVFEGADARGAGAQSAETRGAGAAPAADIAGGAPEAAAAAADAGVMAGAANATADAGPVAAVPVVDALAQAVADVAAAGARGAGSPGACEALGAGLALQLSPGLMAKLQRGSELARSADVQQERRAALHANAVAMVPQTFDVVRGIFGDKGPVVQPKEEVVRLLRQRCTFRSGLSPDQAREQITLLLRMAPAWIKEDMGSGGTLGRRFEQLRINRQLVAFEVRAALVCAAAAPVTAIELQQDVDANAVV